MNLTTPRDSGRIYLDHNATTPPSALVREKIPQWLESWGNPSSIHHAGRGPKALIRDARESIARLLNVHPLELIFTSGGSEANNLAIKGVFDTLLRRDRENGEERTRDHFIFGSVEHPSVRLAAEYLMARGARVDFIPVSRDGAIDLDAYTNLLNEKTALVSVMIANNETGNIFPIRAMAEMAHAKGALFHSDCVQALGKIPVDLRELGVDLASFAGHKFYALKGVGVLFTKRGLHLENLIHGGGQERYRRGGTENTLAIASFGLMCAMKDEILARAEKMAALRDDLENRILAMISDVKLTGAESPRLPNTSSLVIAGVDGETLLMNLDMRGFAVSTGAACSSGSPEPSPALLAMGLSRAEAQSSLRIGLGWTTTEAEIDGFALALRDVVAHLRAITQAPGATPVKRDIVPVRRLPRERNADVTA